MIYLKRHKSIGSKWNYNALKRVFSANDSEDTVCKGRGSLEDCADDHSVFSRS